MDAWAARSHPRAIAAIDDGKFVDEIIPLKVQLPDGSVADFSIDEHPRRDTTIEKLAALKVLRPEIERLFDHRRQQQRDQRRRRRSGTRRP